MNALRYYICMSLAFYFFRGASASASPEVGSGESAIESKAQTESKIHERSSTVWPTPNDEVKSNHELVRTEFKITGTDCPVCLNRIRTKISSLKGVTKAIVWTWSPHFGLVDYDPKIVSWKTIESSVADEHVYFVDLTSATTREKSP